MSHRCASLDGVESNVEQIVQPVAAAAHAYVMSAGFETRPEVLPAPGSRALAEESVEQDYGREDFHEPVRNAHMHAALAHVNSGDHLRSLAWLLATVEDGTLYAHWSLARAVMENALYSVWLHDPGSRPRSEFSVVYAARTTASNDASTWSSETTGSVMRSSGPHDADERSAVATCANLEGRSTQ